MKIDEEFDDMFNLHCLAAVSALVIAHIVLKRRKIVHTQYYANEVCNSCVTSCSVCCKFYCRCNIFSCTCKTCKLHVACVIAVVIGVLNLMFSLIIVHCRPMLMTHSTRRCAWNV